MSSITVVPTVEASNDPPRVRLDVTDSGTPSLFAANVARLNPDGSVSQVRTFDGNPLTLSTSGAVRVGITYDYEMPYGAPVSYSTIESPGNISAEVTVDEQRVWLIHPGVPDLSMPITVASFGSRARKVQRGVFYPMGRTTPVVQTDGSRKSVESTLQVQTFTDLERLALDDLLSDAGTLLLNIPAGKSWGVPTSYIAVGDAEEERLVDYASEPRRYFNLPYVVVDRPAGGTQAERNYTDLLSFSSYAALTPAYARYLDLLAGP